MAWKYIVVRAGNQEVPVIFPEHMVHSLMSALMQEYFVAAAMTVMPAEFRTDRVRDDIRKGVKAVAAGSITFDVGTCTGGSETLKLQSRQVDAELIAGYNYHHGVVPEEE